MASSRMHENVEKNKQSKNINSVPQGSNQSSRSSSQSCPLSQVDDDDDIDYIPVGILQISSGRPALENPLPGSTVGLQDVSGNRVGLGQNAFQQTAPNIPQLEQLDLDNFECQPTHAGDSSAQQNSLNSTRLKGYTQPQLPENIDWPSSSGSDQSTNRNVDYSAHRKEVILQLLQAQQHQRGVRPLSQSSETPVADKNFVQVGSQSSVKQSDFNRNVPMTGSQQLLKILSQPHKEDGGTQPWAQPEPNKAALLDQLDQSTKETAVSQHGQPPATDYKGSSNNPMHSDSYEQLKLMVTQNSGHSELQMNFSDCSDLQAKTEAQPNRVLRIDTSEKLSHNIPKIAEQLLQQSPTQSGTVSALSVQPHSHNLNQQHPEISKRLNSPVSPGRQGGSPWQPPSPRQPGSPRRAMSPRHASGGSPRQPSVSPCQFISPRQSVSPRQFAGSNQRLQTLSPQSFHAPSPRLPPTSPSLPPSSSPARITSSPAQFNSTISYASFPQTSPGQGMYGTDRSIQPPPIQPLASHPSPVSSPGGIVHHRPPMDSAQKFFPQSAALLDNPQVSHAFESSTKSPVPSSESKTAFSRQLGSSHSSSLRLEKSKPDQARLPAIGLFSSQPLTLSSFSLPQMSLSQAMSPICPRSNDVKEFDVNSNDQNFGSPKAGISAATAVSEKSSHLEGERPIVQSPTLSEKDSSKSSDIRSVPSTNASKVTSFSPSVSMSQNTPINKVPGKGESHSESSDSCQISDNVVQNKVSLSVLSEVASEQYVLAVQEQSHDNKRTEYTDKNAQTASKVVSLEAKMPVPSGEESSIDSNVSTRKGRTSSHAEDESDSQKSKANSKASQDTKRVKDVPEDQNAVMAKKEEPTKRLRKPKVPFENDDSLSRGRAMAKKKLNEKKMSLSPSKTRGKDLSPQKSQAKGQTDPLLNSTVMTRSSLKFGPVRRIKGSLDSSKNAAKSVRERKSGRLMGRSMSNSSKDRGRRLQNLRNFRRGNKQDSNKDRSKRNLKKRDRSVSSQSSKDEREGRISTRNSASKLLRHKELVNGSPEPKSGSSQVSEKVTTRNTGKESRSMPRQGKQVQTRMTTRQSDGTSAKGKRPHLEFMESLPLHSRKRSKPAGTTHEDITSVEEDSSQSVQTRATRSKPDSGKNKVSEGRKEKKNSTEDSDPMEQDEEKDDDGDEDFKAEDDDVDEDEDDDDDDEDYETPHKLRRVRPRKVNVRRSTRRRQKVKRISDDEVDSDMDLYEDNSDESTPESKLSVLRKRSGKSELKASKSPPVSISESKKVDSSQSDIVSSEAKTENIKPADLPSMKLADFAGAAAEWSKVNKSKMTAFKLVPVSAHEMENVSNSMVPIVGYMLPGQVSNIIFLPSDQVPPSFSVPQKDAIASEKQPQKFVETTISSTLSSSKPSIPPSVSMSSNKVLVTPKPISSIGISKALPSRSAAWSPTSPNNRSKEIPPSSSMSHWNHNRDLPPPHHPSSSASSSSYHLQTSQMPSTSTVKPSMQSPSIIQQSSTFSSTVPPSVSPTMTTPPPSASSSSSLSSMSWNSAPTMPWLVQEMESSNMGSWSGPQVSAGREELWARRGYPPRVPYTNSVDINDGQMNPVESARLDMQLLDSTKAPSQAVGESRAQGMESGFMGAGGSTQQSFFNESPNLNPDALFTNSPQSDNQLQENKMRQDRILQGPGQQVTPSPSPNYNIALPGLGQQDISFLESKMHQDMDISSSMLLSEVPYEDGIHGHVALDQDPTHLVCSVNLDDADMPALRENSTSLNLPVGVEPLQDNSLLSPSKVDASKPVSSSLPKESSDQSGDRSDESNKKRRQLYEILAEQGKRVCKCLICGNKYSMTSIYRHLRKHNNPEFAFHCDLCSKKYSQKHHLVVHMRKMHKNSQSESGKTDPDAEKNNKEDQDKGSKEACKEHNPRKEGKDSKKKNTRQRSGERKQSKESLFYEEMPDSPTPIDEELKRETQRQVEEFRRMKAEKKYAIRKTLNGIVTDIFSKKQPVKKRAEKTKDLDETNVGRKLGKTKSSNLRTKSKLDSKDNSISAQTPSKSSEPEGSKKSVSGSTQILDAHNAQGSGKPSEEKQLKGDLSVNIRDGHKSDVSVSSIGASSKKEDLVDSTINAVAHSVYTDKDIPVPADSVQESDTQRDVTVQEEMSSGASADLKTASDKNSVKQTKKAEGSAEEQAKIGSKDDPNTPKSKFPCDLCSSVLSSKTSYVMHMRRHNNQKSKFCNYCGKGFITSQELRSHERTHTGERPYQCPICKFSFAHSGSYQAHKKGHIKRGETEPFPEDKCHNGSPPRRRRRTVSTDGKGRQKMESQNMSGPVGGGSLPSPGVPFRPDGPAADSAGRHESGDRGVTGNQGMGDDTDQQANLIRRGSLDSNLARMTQVGSYGDGFNVGAPVADAGSHRTMISKGPDVVAPGGPFAAQNYAQSYPAAPDYGMMPPGGQMIPQQPKQGQADNYPPTPSSFPAPHFSSGQPPQYAGQSPHHQHSTPIPPHQMSPYPEYYHHQSPRPIPSPHNPNTPQDGMAKASLSSKSLPDTSHDKLPRTFDQNQYMYPGDSMTPLTAQQNYPQMAYNTTMASDCMAYNTVPKTDSSSNEIVKSLLEHYHVPATPFAENMQVGYSGSDVVGSSSYAANPSQNPTMNPLLPSSSSSQPPPPPPPPPYNPEVPPPPYTASIQYKDYYNSGGMGQACVDNSSLVHSSKQLPLQTQTQTHPGDHLMQAPVYHEPYKEAISYPAPPQHPPTALVSVIRSNVSHGSGLMSEPQQQYAPIPPAVNEEPRPQYLPNTAHQPSPAGRETVHTDFNTL